VKSRDEARKVVQEVVDNFLAKGVTQEELEGAKKFFLGSEPLRTETLSQRMSRAFHEYYDGLGLEWSKKELKIIEAMKLEIVDPGLRVQYVPDGNSLDACFEWGQKIGAAIVGE